jgi:hypothetical protein
MKARYKILIALVALVMVGTVIAMLYVFRTTKPDMLKQKTDFRIEATALYGEFEADEQAATGKYAGKIIEVSGSVELVEKSEWGHVTIALIDPFFGVTCTLDSLQAANQPGVVAAVKTGTLITIKGRCEGMLTDVKVGQCVILTGTKSGK